MSDDAQASHGLLLLQKLNADLTALQAYACPNEWFLTFFDGNTFIFCHFDCLPKPDDFAQGQACYQKQLS